MTQTRKLWSAVIISCTIIFTVCGILTIRVLASDNKAAASKSVISVEIKKGDTLWSIAQKYYTHEYNSIDEYILEIKRSNRLVSDTIHAGQYIIIPFFEYGVTAKQL